MNKVFRAAKLITLVLVFSFGSSFVYAQTVTPLPPVGTPFRPPDRPPETQIVRPPWPQKAPTPKPSVGKAWKAPTANPPGDNIIFNRGSATPTSGLLMRAVHTFKDCTSQGGRVYPIDGDTAKNICVLPSLPTGWRMYPPGNWTKTSDVSCKDSGAGVRWDKHYGTTLCNTGEHSFSSKAIESCTSVTTGASCRYKKRFLRRSTHVCDNRRTSTTCNATVKEVGAY